METIVLWLSLALFYEARGEPVQCQIDVSRVILERSRLSGTSVQDVILAPGQFPWVKDVFQGTTLKPESRPNRDGMAWKQVEQSAIRSLYLDDTIKATHFHSKIISRPISWSKLSVTHECGNHIFYK
jgi:N-acetylmuramoyl-L-alanine amidase